MIYAGLRNTSLRRFLGYLLIHDNLRGVCEFIRFLCRRGLTSSSFTHSIEDAPFEFIEIPATERQRKVEVVTELNIFRDHAFWYGREPASHSESVPDVVIRYDDSIFVIEAKFFGVPRSNDKLNSQIRLQRKVSSISLAPCIMVGFAAIPTSTSVRLPQTRRRSNATLRSSVKNWSVPSTMS